MGDRKYNPEKTGREPLCLCSAALEIQTSADWKEDAVSGKTAGEGFQAFDMEGYVDKSEKSVKSLDETCKMCIM